MQYYPATNTEDFSYNDQTDEWLLPFLSSEPKVLGALQILIGIVTFCLGGVLLWGLSLSAGIMVEFLSSIFFIVSGSRSICAEKKKSVSQVKCALGLNTTSSIVAFIAFIIYVLDLAIVLRPNLCPPISSSNVNLSSLPSNYCKEYYESSQALTVGVVAVLLILSLLEFSISLTTAIYGCVSVC